MKLSSPLLRHLTIRTKPPSIHSSPSELTRFTAPATPAVGHRIPSDLHVSRKLCPCTTQAGHTSNAPRVGRSVFSQPRLLSIPTQTLLHYGPSLTPALTNPSGKSLHVKHNSTVATGSSYARGSSSKSVANTPEKRPTLTLGTSLTIPVQLVFFTRLEESSLVPAGFLTAQFLQKT